ncbi:MalY/PatB family protein [Streptomyces sp. NBC_00328]|uniref:MalY/PatB family protein n=1 Tax=Streptomyces sp. NBC_00328 TaxID=2903646 RepID=UPI002E2C3936|nr:aminotransferase class I/II-fold pyridoxal phosphate-dependent enzyme [Streptomyces sp. NBC_00328]
MTRLVALSDEQLRAGPGLKWGRARPEVIPADVAELDFAVAPAIRAALWDAVDRSDLGYPDYTTGAPTQLAELFAHRSEEQWGWRANPAATEVCAQITQALCCAILAFTRPGDQILTHSPTYPPFIEAIRSLGRRPVLVPAGNLSEEAVATAWAKAAEERDIRMIVLCQPHNPTGHVFDFGTLEEIARLAVGRNAVVFSDEIHADILYAGTEFRSIVSVGAAADRTIVFTSAAKSFNIAGLRCAVGHFGTAELHARFRRLPWHLRSGASALGLAATIAAWESCDEWLEQLRTQLSANRARLLEFLSNFDQVHVRPPAATYLAWIDLRAAGIGPDAGSFLESAGRIALYPGSLFGASLGEFVRLNFGTSAARLEIILERLGDALEGCHRKGSKR